ncbi:uncharacterized protein LOC143462228 [Clavelina lepadiformis]|uniref:uncharacterized protein LOC143462228 n=1 Tax=Clavelina lepadiformis TaxID=159417 RepID=UPI0040422729
MQTEYLIRRRACEKAKPTYRQNLRSFVKRAWWEYLLYCFIASAICICCIEALNSILDFIATHQRCAYYPDQVTSFLQNTEKERIEIIYTALTDTETGHVKHHFSVENAPEGSVLKIQPTTDEQLQGFLIQLHDEQTQSESSLHHKLLQILPTPLAENWALGNFTQKSRLIKLKEDIAALRFKLFQEKLMFLHWQLHSRVFDSILIGQELLTWEEAKQACAQNEASLLQLSIFDHAIFNEFLNGIIMFGRGYWLGIYYSNNSWWWLDDTPTGAEKSLFLELGLSRNIIQNKSEGDTVYCVALTENGGHILQAQSCNRSKNYALCERI